MSRYYVVNMSGETMYTPEEVIDEESNVGLQMRQDLLAGTLNGYIVNDVLFVTDADREKLVDAVWNGIGVPPTITTLSGNVAAQMLEQEYQSIMRLNN